MIEIIESRRTSTPPLRSTSYFGKNKGNYIVENNIYTEEYIENLLYRIKETAFTNSAHQSKIHATCGQTMTKTRANFGSLQGSPLICSIFPKSENLPEWVVRTLKLCKDGNEDAALKAISLTTGQYKTNGDFSQLSKDLKCFNLEKLSDIILISLLRNTYSIHSKILHWNSLINEIEKILKNRNRDPRILLRGLKN